jgi:hypothetical protein
VSRPPRLYSVHRSTNDMRDGSSPRVARRQQLRHQRSRRHHPHRRRRGRRQGLRGRRGPWQRRRRWRHGCQQHVEHLVGREGRARGPVRRRRRSLGSRWRHRRRPCRLCGAVRVGFGHRVRHRVRCRGRCGHGPWWPPSSLRTHRGRRLGRCWRGWRWRCRCGPGTLLGGLSCPCAGRHPAGQCTGGAGPCSLCWYWCYLVCRRHHRGGRGDGRRRGSAGA